MLSALIHGTALPLESASSALKAQNLHYDALGALTIEFCVKDALPGAQIQPASVAEFRYPDGPQWTISLVPAQGGR